MASRHHAIAVLKEPARSGPGCLVHAGSPGLWVSQLMQQVLEQSQHMDEHCKRQASRLVALLSAYAVHDPGTGYCQG
jgi:hypothetical protein